MKIVYIASYGPRKCGIATFTGNKRIGMKADSEHESIVVAMNDPHNEYDYPEEVKFVIRQDHAADYIDAANFINNSGADICILEHEFGIFGARDGSYILTLLHRLQIPVLAVLHTVLKNPSLNQRAITKEITSIAARTVVMNNKAVEFLTQVYGIRREKITIIDHGIPDFEFDRNMMKRSLGLEGKNVLLTFGLISRNKGIETALKALPPVIEKHPDTVYIVLGKTHPSVVKHAGEEYREYLETLAAELGIAEYVKFVNEFTDEKKLFKYLSATDIYITPYLNEAQITSGTLSYAVGAGCAVISTPYWHAEELLTEDKGRLFNFNDHEKLSTILNELLGDPALLKTLRRNARRYGREVSWPRIGQIYLDLSESLIKEYAQQITGKEARFDPENLPAFSLDHIKRMTDDTGLLQHAKYGIPNFKEGYCLDDNARALLMCVMAYRLEKPLQVLELLPVYLGYIHYMQNDDGTFRNFLSYNRNFLDEVGSEDSFGRTIWALGYLLQHPPTLMHYHSGRDIFMLAARNFENLHHIRAIANTIIGISYYLRRETDDANMKQVLRNLTAKLVDQYRHNAHGDWKWFEEMLTYDNAVLPLSLLHAAEILEDNEVMQVATESMDFLSCISLANGCLSVVGNEKWYAKTGVQSLFAQQPVDAMMMVLLFQKAYELNKDERYLKNLQTSYMWFLGENDLRLHLYDRETKGCYDGLESYGVNRNQGAESTLAYLISRLTVQEVCMANALPAEENKNSAESFIKTSGVAV